MCSSRMTGYSETEPLPAGGERQKQNRKPGNSVCARSWVGIHAKGISDSSAHQHVGAETRAAKGGNDLESLLLEHRCGAVRRFISEGVRFPARDGIGFDETPTLLFYGFESGFQGSAGYAACAVLLKHSEASDPPKFCGGFRSEASIFAAVVDAGKLLPGAVLAPADRLSLRVNEDAMGKTAVDEFLLFAAVPYPSLCSGAQPLALGQAARAVKVHAPTKVPAVLLGEKPDKIRPGLL